MSESPDTDKIELSEDSLRVLKEAFDSFAKKQRELKQLYQAEYKSIESERKGVIKTIRELSGVPEDYILDGDGEEEFYFRPPTEEEKNQMKQGPQSIKKGDVPPADVEPEQQEMGEDVEPDQQEMEQENKDD